MDYKLKYFKYKTKYQNLKTKLQDNYIHTGGNPKNDSRYSGRPVAYRPNINYNMHAIVSDAVRFGDGDNLPLYVSIKETVDDDDIKKVKFNEISGYLLKDMKEVVESIDDESYILCIGYHTRLEDGTKVDGDVQIGLTGTVERGESFKDGSARELLEEGSISPDDSDDAFKVVNSKYAKLNIGNAIVDSGEFSGGAKTNVVVHGSEEDVRSKIKDMAMRQHAYQTHKQTEINSLSEEIDTIRDQIETLESQIKSIKNTIMDATGDSTKDAYTDVDAVAVAAATQRRTLEEKTRELTDKNISKISKEEDKKKLKYDTIQYYLFMNKSTANKCIDVIEKMKKFWDQCRVTSEISSYFIYDFENNKAIIVFLIDLI